MAVISQLVARRVHNLKVANSILTHRIYPNVRRLILRLSIVYRDHVLLGRLDGQLPSARIAGPTYFSASQHDAGMSSKGYGATAARLTPDQKDGSSNLSALIFHMMLTTPGNPSSEPTSKIAMVRGGSRQGSTPAF